MRNALTTLLTLSLVLSLAACGGAAPAPPPSPDTASGEAAAAPPDLPKTMFSVAGGTSGSLFVNFTAAVADVLTNHVPGMNITVEPGGSSQNLVSIHERTADFSITSTLQNYPGVHGLDWAKGVKYDDACGWIPAYSYEGFFLVLDSSPVKTMRDLTGRSVAVGAAGSGSDVTGRQLVEFFGLRPKELVNGSWTDIGGQLKDGLVDGVFYLAGHPASFVQELETTHKLRIVPISDAELEKFRETRPYYEIGTLKAGTYDCVPEDLHVVQGWNMMAINPDLPDDFVYAVTRALWENIETVRQAHSSFWMTDLDNVRYVNLPLHPGARRYYEEMGVRLPTLPAPPAN